MATGLQVMAETEPLAMTPEATALANDGKACRLPARFTHDSHGVHAGRESSGRDGEAASTGHLGGEDLTAEGIMEPSDAVRLWRDRDLSTSRVG